MQSVGQVWYASRAMRTVKAGAAEYTLTPGSCHTLSGTCSAHQSARYRRQDLCLSAALLEAWDCRSWMRSCVLLCVPGRSKAQA